MNMIRVGNKKDIDANVRKQLRLNRPFMKNTINQVEPFKKALVLAAGPTLDDNWGLIKKYYYEGWIIICVSRALRCCMYEGIVPNIVMHIDPTSGVDHFFKDISKDYLKKPVLVASPIARNKLLREWKGRIAFYYPSHWDRMDRHNCPSKIQKATLFEANHVGATAVSFALAMGAEVKLYGHDHTFRGVKVMDPVKGEAVVCFQYYASPWPTTWVGYRNKNIRAELNRPPDEQFIQNTYPYQIGPHTFTTDGMQSNLRVLRKVFYFYKKELPCHLKPM